MRPSCCLVALLILTQSCTPSVSEGNNLPQLGFSASPERIIERLEKEPKTYREHFLLGVAHRKKGNLKRAIHHFANSCFSYHTQSNLRLFPIPVYIFVSGFHVKSEYFDDAVAEIADIFFRYREFEYVARFADLVGDEQAALHRDAVLLKVRALTEMKKHDEALKELKRLYVKYKDSQSRSLIKIREASVHERNEDLRGAAANYLEIIALGEGNWQSSIASQRLQELSTKSGISYSPREKLMLAKGLYHASKYDEAVNLLREASAGLKDSSSLEECTVFLIRSLVRKGRLADADRVIRGSGKKPLEVLRLAKLKADELWESGKKTAAVNEYRTLADSADREIAQASLRRIIAFMDDKRKTGLEKLAREYNEKYPDDDFSEFCLWVIGRETLRRNDDRTAMALFESTLKKFPAGLYSDRQRFWLHRLYSVQGRKADAERMFRQMAAYNPGSSYTWVLFQRRKGDYSQEDLLREFNTALKNKNREGYLWAHALLFIRERDLEKRNARIDRLPGAELEQIERLNKQIAANGLKSAHAVRLKRLERYFAVGHADGIVRELGVIPDTVEGMRDKNIALAHFGGQYCHENFALYSTLNLMREDKIHENITLFPEEMLGRLLPVAFPQCVKAAAREFKLETPAIYALIKAESLFNPRAVSSAGAVGYMQLMPDTARGIARTLRVKSYDLKDPCTSIRFGAHYLAWLGRMFKGNFVSVVAAYNAGAGNVIKWRKTHPADDDYFTEFLPFEETRYYILRTRKFLTQYEILAPR